MEKQIRSCDDMERYIQEVGFLPLFGSEINGFSVEDHIAQEYWFDDHNDGPWEWKDIVMKKRTCLYGKFFNKKTGFIGRDWLADFINYRRDGYDFDARYEDGLAARKDKYLFDTVWKHEEIFAKELRELCNYGKGGNKGFDTVMTRLQMQLYVVPSEYVYMIDKTGKPYGWGVVKYSTPEHLLGESFVYDSYQRSPEASKNRIEQRLRELYPDATDKAIKKMLG